MALQFSTAARNARLDTIEATAGASAKLRILSGAAPANAAAAQTGTLLCEIALPADWMANAGAGAKAMSGTWSAAAAAAGIAGYFRIVDNAGANCHIQGAIPADMTLDNTNIAVSQVVTVNSFTITDGNA